MSRKVTEAYLDRKARDLVKERPGGCQSCGHYLDSYDAAHIIGRSVRSTRWMQPNLLKLCRSCHGWFGHRPTVFTQWCIDKLGQDHVDTLNRISCVLMKDARLTKEDVNGMLTWSLDEWEKRIVG